MQCEICGREGARYKVYIEGAELLVCRRCKGDLPTIRTRKRKKKEEVEEQIVENYGAIIKEAREKMGLSREELAKKIAVKEHYLNHIEKEEMLPEEQLLNKLEKFLGIKLKEKVVISSSQVGKKEALTLEDIAEIKKSD